MEPFYGITDIVPITHECSICNTPITEEQSKFKLCEKHEHEALQRFLHYLCNEFTDNEREYIDACVEGNSLTEPEKIKDIKAIY